MLKLHLVLHLLFKSYFFPFLGIYVSLKHLFRIYNSENHTENGKDSSN
jgi:hypothetical protein